MHSVSGEIMVKSKVRNAERDDFLFINNEENVEQRTSQATRENFNKSVEERNISKIMCKVSNSTAQKSRRTFQNNNILDSQNIVNVQSQDAPSQTNQSNHNRSSTVTMKTSKTQRRNELIQNKSLEQTLATKLAIQHSAANPSQAIIKQSLNNVLKNFNNPDAATVQKSI